MEFSRQGLTEVLDYLPQAPLSPSITRHELRQAPVRNQLCQIRKESCSTEDFGAIEGEEPGTEEGEDNLGSESLVE
ncbi:hypothetical protein DY000_02017701 [Brassica cretica]|uniref:Uncharacterized protein n=1 Tax=Brassica cretica TaxID=69181 RepID=A0ABQ7CZR4_BRACR|nr:hypothetical protein DY000_02017701 [Brassica cretica]